MRHIVLLAACAVAFAACTPSEPTPTAGLANPASQYCGSLGGRTEIRNEAEGQVGYCRLPDGSVTEEWALYRARAGQQ